MAGTPTTNYNFPTYADTDVPDLTGAYNQAVNAIDAKIKEVADTIPSDADVPDATSTTKGIAKLYDSATVGAGDQDDGGITPKAVEDKIDGSLTGYAPKFTVAAPITYSGNQIGVTQAKPGADGAISPAGIVQVTGKQADIGTATILKSSIVPNCKAVKDYVDAKLPTEQQAYTGTAPVVVDNESKTISVGGATTSTKGIVQLTNTFRPTDETNAATPSCVNNSLVSVTASWQSLQKAATTPLTTEMLANLYVTPSGMVVYKAPTE